MVAKRKRRPVKLDRLAIKDAVREGILEAVQFINLRTLWDGKRVSGHTDYQFEVKPK
jgi:hypothetical protein